MTQTITRVEAVAPSNIYVWYVVWFLFVVNILNYVDRMLLSILIEDIRIEIPMTDSQIGLVTGLAFALFYAFAGLIMGRLSDIYSRKTVLTVAITGWSLATAACGLAANFWSLLSARVLVGFGEAGTMPASQSLLGDYCSIRQRAAAYAILAAGGSMGLMIGLAGGGYLADELGWRAAFFVAGVAGLPVAAFTLLTLHEPIRGRHDVSPPDAGDQSRYLDILRKLFSNRSYLWIAFASSCTGFLLYGVAQWMPVFLIRQYGLSTSQVGLLIGLSMGVGAGIGAIVGGFATNYLVRRGEHWLVTLPLGVNILVVPLYWAIIHAPSLELTFILLLCANVFGAISFGAIIAGMQSVVPAHMRASASAVYGLISSLFGVGLAPFLVGVMSDLLSGGAQTASSLKDALTIAVVVGWGTPICLLFARKTFLSDLVSRV